MTVTRSVLFVLVACVCFAVALLIAITAITGNAPAFVAGGLLSLALSFLS